MKTGRDLLAEALADQSRIDRLVEKTTVVKALGPDDFVARLGSSETTTAYLVARVVAANAHRLEPHQLALIMDTAVDCDGGLDDCGAESLRLEGLAAYFQARQDFVNSVNCKETASYFHSRSKPTGKRPADDALPRRIAEWIRSLGDEERRALVADALSHHGELALDGVLTDAACRHLTSWMRGRGWKVGDKSSRRGQATVPSPCSGLKYDFHDLACEERIGVADLLKIISETRHAR